jgi:RNA polymerase sigma factor (sigma-70 family)
MTKAQFASIITSYESALRVHALRFTQDVEDANDLLQDTLIKAFRHFDQFEENTNLKGWLFTIMRNTFINTYRKNSKTQAIVVQSEDITYQNLAYSATINQSTTDFVLGDIKGALSKLPVHLSVPFVRYVEGYKYQEISEELNIPLGTVKTRIHEARKHLAKMLKMYKERLS